MGVGRGQKELPAPLSSHVTCVIQRQSLNKKGWGLEGKKVLWVRGYRNRPSSGWHLPHSKQGDLVNCCSR